MFKSIYIRLALTNLKKNKRSYVPFLLTSIITIMMFFDMYMIMDNSGVREAGSGQYAEYPWIWYGDRGHLCLHLLVLYEQLFD